ncbi:MAG: hypothetical protein NT079_05360 [Candidatus Omnitrophica bacterium]|nr:hypothetical protein [Candidatus Omnitrophota bacterium]
MSRSGKTLTIFLVVFFLLLISLTSIVTFFLVKEREARQATEKKLTISEDSRRKVEDQYKVAQDEILVLNNKLKEQDNKINSLVDEIEFEKGLREEIKKENATLKTQVDSITSEKMKFQDDVIALQEKNTSLQNELTSATSLRDQIATKLQEAEVKIKEFEAKLSASTAVNLEKIVVAPSEPANQSQKKDGQVLKINAGNNFVIINLGEDSGVAENTVVQFYRGNSLLGEGKITRVQSIMSAVDVLPPLSAGNLQVKDRVIIKK